MSNSSDRIEFYWRPGCGFCIALERGLEKLGLPLERLNIWEDAEAAAFVRSVAGGNETVPTVRIGSTSLVNPRVDAVVAALTDEAPELVPDDYSPGAVSRLLAKITRADG